MTTNEEFSNSAVWINIFKRSKASGQMLLNSWQSMILKFYESSHGKVYDEFQTKSDDEIDITQGTISNYEINEMEYSIYKH